MGKDALATWLNPHPFLVQRYFTKRSVCTKIYYFVLGTETFNTIYQTKYTTENAVQ